MEDEPEANPDLSDIAEVVLKIAALVGVAAAIASFGLNFAQCASSFFGVAVSVPSFILAFLVFGLALGLTDKTFGSFRDMDLWSGNVWSKISKHLLFMLGSIMEMSLFAVAFYSFRAAGNLPNCVN